jgi:protein TonB
VTTKVPPEYPVIAKQLKIEGAVELEAIVAESGVVEKVNIVSGNPVLTRPASDALKKWKFAPFTSDGKPVKAIVPVGLSFKM